MKQKSIFKSKKGDIFQIFFVMIIIFIVAVVGLLVITLSTNITSTIAKTPVIQQTPMASNMNQQVGAIGIPMADYFVFFLFLFGNIALIIAATRTNFSATLIFLFIILFLFAILIAAGFVNIYSGLANNSALIGTSSQLTLTGVIFSKYFPLFICVISGIIIAIMYGKSGSDIIS